MINAIQRHLPLQETSLAVAQARTSRNAQLLKGEGSLFSPAVSLQSHDAGKASVIIKNGYMFRGKGGWKQIHERDGKIEN